MSKFYKGKTIKEEENRIKEEIQEINDIELDKFSKVYAFDKFYDFLIKSFSFIVQIIVFLCKISSFYMLWICLHYFSAHLYTTFCVPNTFVGFVMSPFMISTPHCQGLRWIVYNAGNVMNQMWILIGTWIYSLIYIV
jgi:hypothetical protein